MSLLGISDIARATGLHKSVVSRYVSSHPELNRADPGKPPQVDLEEFIAHRAGALDLSKAGNRSGTPFTAKATAPAAPLFQPAAPPSANGVRTESAAAPPSHAEEYARHRAAQKEIQAHREAIAFEKELGSLADVADFTRVISQIFGSVTAYLTNPPLDLAQSLVGLTEREIHAALRDWHRAQLASLSRRVAEGAAKGNLLHAFGPDADDDIDPGAAVAGAPDGPGPAGPS